MSRPTLCSSHLRGRAPGVAYAYYPTCVKCVETRGHLPPEQRDVHGYSYARQMRAEARGWKITRLREGRR